MRFATAQPPASMPFLLCGLDAHLQQQQQQAAR